MSDRDHRPGLLERWLLALVPLLLRLHALSLRYRVEGLEAVHELLAAGKPVLLASWHGRVLLLPFHLRGLLQTLMISRSRDGERIATICERIGYSTVRGSSSRSGAQALLEVVGELKENRVVGHVVDGPRGPAGEIKPGLVAIAQRSGAAIVPIYATAARRWEAPSWDRMQLAYPFSRVLVRYGPPVEVSPELDAEAFEELRLELERRMRTEYARLEADLAAR
jgi:lysophospholipid acyltransferase (LPLAT)-like uncharacterized protein